MLFPETKQALVYASSTNMRKEETTETSACLGSVNHDLKRSKWILLHEEI